MQLLSAKKWDSVRPAPKARNMIAIYEAGSCQEMSLG
jgi:hypothetical protein